MTDLSKIELILKNTLPPEIKIGVTELPCNSSCLTTNELSYLKNVKSPGRHNAFILGRMAAKQALRELGVEPEILRAEDGSPVWPKGAKGSLSNKTDIGVAIASTAPGIQSMGIDLERNLPNLNILKKITVPSEQMWVEESDSANRLTAIFTAKEAIFKTIYPLKKQFFGFKDAELQPTASGFSCLDLVKFPDITLDNLRIKTCICEGVTISVAWLEAN